MSALSEARLRALVEARRGVLAELELEEILKRVLGSARELTGAHYAALGVLDSDRVRLERFITDGIDEQTRHRIGELPTGRGVLGVLIADPRPLRLDRVADHPQAVGFPEGHPAMGAFLGVPVTIRGVAWGNLYLTEKEDGAVFSEADEESAVMLADSAAIAIDHSRSVDRARLRQSIQSAELERGRWARELHDETLQGLGALRVALASALRRGGDYEAVVTDAVVQLGEEITKLRALITDLRPASLSELGLQAALEALAHRVSTRTGTEVKTVVALAFDVGAERERLDHELEEAIYRIAQEGLTNASKHAHASRVEVKVIERTREVELSVTDDGIGFDPAATSGGYGLAGIRERAELVGGSARVSSSEGGGTTLSATFPATRAEPYRLGDEKTQT